MEILNIYLHEGTRSGSVTKLFGDKVPVDRRLALKDNEDQKVLLGSIVPDDAGRRLACWHFADCKKIC
jgi:hypothetical protein